MEDIGPHRTLSSGSLPVLGSSTLLPASHAVSSPAASSSSAPVSSLDVDALRRSLSAFAEQGAWRNVFKLTESVRSSDVPRGSALYYDVKLCRVLSLVKLHLHKNAAEELAAIEWNAAADVTSSSTSSSSTMSLPSVTNFNPVAVVASASNAPFSLRLLAAVLPSLQGNHGPSLDALYALLAWAKTHPVADKQHQEQRILRIALTQAAVLTRQGDLLCALDVLEQQRAADPSSPVLHTAVGRVCLELGDLARAEKAFNAASPLLLASPDLAPVDAVNRGLLAFARGECEVSIAQFQKILLEAPDAPSAVSATNNRAVCLLFTKDLNGAVDGLQTSLHTKPVFYLEEVLVFNLCTLYDLSSEKPNEKKADLSKLIASYGGDTFDATLTSGGA